MGLLKNKEGYIHFLSKMSSKQKRLITAVIALTIVSLWFFFIHSTIQKKITHNKEVLYQINRKKLLLEKSKNNCKRIKKKIKYLKSDIKSYAVNIDTKNSAPLSTSQIISDAKSFGIQLKSYSTLEELNNQNKVAYEFTGNIDRALAFCEKLKQNTNALECQEACLATGDKNSCNLKCILSFLKS